MKTLAVLGLCLAGWTSMTAQTNQQPFRPDWFVIPQLSLRPPIPEKTPILPLPEFKLQTTLVLPQESDHPSTSLTIESPAFLTQELSTAEKLRDFDLQIYDRLEKQGFFNRVEPTENRIERFLDSVFSPETIQFRKVTFSCSVVTAFKRKNPLCLLNPCVLQLSW